MKVFLKRLEDKRDRYYHALFKPKNSTLTSEDCFERIKMQAKYEEILLIISNLTLSENSNQFLKELGSRKWAYHSKIYGRTPYAKTNDECFERIVIQTKSDELEEFIKTLPMAESLVVKMRYEELKSGVTSLSVLSYSL